MSESESKRCKHTDSDFDKKVPRTSATILLKEYRHIGVFSPAEAAQLEDEKTRAEVDAGLSCFICSRADYEEGRIDLDEYRKRNAGRAKIKEKLLNSLRQKIHDTNEKNKPTALCLSGGGIRSAIFSLGVLQGLAKHGLLDQFHYLSTVSGGGYMGSWLSAWLARGEEDDSEYAAWLAEKKKEPEYAAWLAEKEKRESAKKIKPVQSDPNPANNEEENAPEFVSKIKYVQSRLNPANHTAVNVEPKEIDHLRKYSNYMSPRLGLMSSDTMTLVAVYLRNLLLNWTVLLPMLAAVLILPRVFISILEISNKPLIKDWFDYPSYLLPAILAAVFGVVGTLLILLARPSFREVSRFKQHYTKDDINILSNSDKIVFILCFLPVILLAVLSTVYWYIVKNSGNRPGFCSFAGFGIILFVGGFLLAVSTIWKYYKTEERGSWEATSITERFAAFIEKQSFLSEMIASAVCGFAGGSLLYLGAIYFDKITPLVNDVFSNTREEIIFVCFGVPLFLLIFLISATFYVGIISKFTGDIDREWISRFGGWILLAIGGWLIISLTVLFGYKLFQSVGYWNKAVASFGGISGLIALIVSFSRSSPAKPEQGQLSWTDKLMLLAPQIAAPIAILVLFSLISFVTYRILAATQSTFHLLNSIVWLGIFLLIVLVMGFFININKFSLHAMYRERLIRAFLGASNAKFEENANAFTGLDSDNDNIEMYKLDTNKPFHVVNMTLNLSRPDNLAWQSRKAESFTVTPLYCGSSNMGKSGNYRPTNKYGGSNSSNKKPITLGTAAAISGAAASPNMGYYTLSSAVVFLMVLFNVRLGWWLGNTGIRGKDTWRSSTPVLSPQVFLGEALGRTDDKNEYIYLSDGGHFDNLGLYEMILRRCNLIVVCDAGADGGFSFSDFAQAIHKIRVDFGISIEFEENFKPKEGRNCAIGSIKYRNVDKDGRDGTLIYIKPTLDGNEPIDLVNYKKENPDFPHESTADQFFGETQFESYRTLGFQQIDSICNGGSEDFIKCSTLLNLKKRAGDYLGNLNQSKGKTEKRRKNSRLRSSYM